MKQNLLRATLATLAIVVGASSFAHGSKDRSDSRAAAWREYAAMEPVPNLAGTGQPGAGWHYFSDRAKARAVVISPTGEYFYSRGKGLRLADGASDDGR